MEQIYDSSTQLLKKPLSFSELIEKGVQFEVDTADINNSLYDDTNLDDDDLDDEGIETEELVSPWTKSFAELRQLMTPIGEHMHKRITRNGDKERGLVPDKARVSLRYSAYWESESAPFDSSMLRGTKFEFATGCNLVLEGLEAAVRTMYPLEQAEFIISYNLLFRELGCPPRIRPRADGLFKIEVIDFTLIGDQQSLENIAPEDRTKFAIVYPKVQDMHLHGKDCAKRGSYRNGVAAFENAISSLNYCRLADEKDEQKQTELLIILYTNLMVCYNKLSKPRRVCIAMKALRHLTRNQPSCKALFQEGRALAALGEYERAREAFVKAQAKEPNNKEISVEIIQMNERVTKYKRSIGDLWKRALSGKQPEQNGTTDENSENSTGQQFKRDFISKLDEFEKSSQQSMHLNRNMYTDKEFDVLRLLATKRSYKLSLSPLNVNQLTLSKPRI